MIKKKMLIFFEVPFDAKRNDQGVKPSSIEIWHPNAGIDKVAIHEALMSFSSQFLNIYKAKLY